MSTLANLMVGLGYDLSALEKGSPEAFRLINQQTLGMSAEMKRSSREGAESFRLIDEALGIHVSRPLTRILTQEFPGLAKALQSVIGVGIVGAVGAVGVEGIEKISKAIENAKKAQDEWRDAALNTDETIQSTLGGLASKLAELRGGRSDTIKFVVEGAEAAKTAIDTIGKALDKEATAATNATSLTSRLWTGIGEFISMEGKGLSSLLDMFGGNQIAEAFGTKNLRNTLFDSQGLQNMKDALADMRTDLEIALNNDKENGTHTAFVLIQNDIKATTAYLNDMRKAGDQAGIALATREQKFFENAGKAESLAGAIAGAEIAQKDMRELQDELKAWNDQNNKSFESWLKLIPEISAALAQSFKDAGMAAEEGSAIVKMNESALKETAARGKEVSLSTQVLPPSGAPTRGDQIELMKLTGQMPGETSIDQQTESWRKAAQIIDEIETPLQKYQTGLAVLTELQKEGRITTEQFAAAQQLLGERATEAELHLEQMQKQLEKLLSQSTSAKAGVQAFFLELQIESSQNGKAAFDLLNTGLKGFEDTLTKLVFDGKAKWKDLFRSMGEEAFKFMLNKEVSGLFTTLGGTSIGKSIGLGSLIPNLAGGASMTAAATTLQTGSTMLMTASTELQSAAANLSIAGVGGSGGSTFNPFSFIPGFASGTDSAPGGFAWVGEQGPELLKLPAGASVTPGAGVRTGGDQNIYIDAKGAEIGVEDKISLALQRARPGIVGEAVASFREIQRRTPSR